MLSSQLTCLSQGPLPLYSRKQNRINRRDTVVPHRRKLNCIHHRHRRRQQQYLSFASITIKLLLALIGLNVVPSAHTTQPRQTLPMNRLYIQRPMTRYSYICRKVQLTARTTTNSLRYTSGIRRQRLFSEAVPNDLQLATADDDDDDTRRPDDDATTINAQSQPQQQMSYQLIQEIAASTKIAAREKRKKLLRVAKAIDRGLPNVTTYNPCVITTSTTTIPSTKIVSFISKSGLPDRSKLFTVLGIESSCDDTGVAIVRSDGTILGEALMKQNDIHEQWGGVVPGLARDAHVNAIDSAVETALKNANLTSIQNDIDAIAVTVGPGLEICLRVGCQKAISLAQQYDKPYVGVHHLEAHILMARIPTQSQSAAPTGTTTSIVDNADLVHYSATSELHESSRTVAFPFLAMLVSGGHCQLIKCIGIGQYEILGGTLDDSLGEAYDKVARLLGLPVGGGGGPAVERLAKKGNPKAIPFTLPMQTSNSLDFSYAGLKTNVRRACEEMVRKRNEEVQKVATDEPGNGTTTATKLIESVDQLPDDEKADIAASFQHIAIRHIEEKLKRAMTVWEKQYDGPNYNDHRSGTDDFDGSSEQQYTLALVGGVAANQELRTRIERLCQTRTKPWKMLVPPPRLCTDQGAMSAWAGIERLMVGSSDDPSSDKVYARYPFAAPQQSKASPSEEKQ